MAEADFPLLLTRRDHLAALLPGILIYALLGEAQAAAPAERGSSAASWIAAQDELARTLAAGEITGPAWCDEVERLGSQVDLEALMAAVRRAPLPLAGRPAGNDPRKRFVNFLDADGTPRRLAYGAALFEFQPHNVITPHGHKHMVSAHMVVAGRFRVRNFDRLRDEENAMVIRPTRDYVARVGDVSTMCSARDNIHWFVPQGGPATTFDVVVSDLDPGQPSYDIKAIDPVRGRRLADGTIAAPIIGFDEASRRYTAEV
jgi:hypothetical protein